MAWWWSRCGGSGAVLIAVTVLLPTAAARGERLPERVPGELLVRWREGAAPPPGTPVRLGAATAVVRAGVAPGVQLLRLTRLADGEAPALAVLRRRADVIAAEPNFLRRAQTRDPEFGAQWALAALATEAAWRTSRGAAAVTVAVVDTGVVPSHPDLAGQLLPGFDFVSQLSRSGDGDGRDADPADPGVPPAAGGALGAAAHGTYTAGIIAAISDNGVAVAGAAPGIRILPVRVLGVDGAGGDADIAAGIRWAAGLSVAGVPDNPHPARVVNLSFSGPGLGFTLAGAVADATAAGALVIGAVGNDGVDGADYAPAGLPLVVGVGATCRDGRLADYSNYGASLDLVAPGGCLDQDLDGDDLPDGIVGLAVGSTADGAVVQWAEGTSPAAAHASAVAALALSVAPELTPAQLEVLLAQSATAVPGCDEGCGAGGVRADRAVELAGACAARDPVCDFVSPSGRVLTSTLPACAAASSPAGGDLLLPAVALLLLARRRRPRDPRPRPRFTRDPRPATPTLTRDPDPGSRDPDAARDPDPGSRDPDAADRDPDPGSRARPRPARPATPTQVHEIRTRPKSGRTAAVALTASP